MFRLTALRKAALTLTLLVLAAAAITGDYFARDIVAEIATLTILVIALELAAGFGGMVSLAHGAIMGVGAYGYALAGLAGMSAWPASLAGIAAAAIFGGAVGAACARTEGIFFIMATLAFGQMAWAFTFRADALGGDNGLGGIDRPSLPFADSADPLVFALYALSVLVLVILMTVAILRSPFGRSLQAVHENPARAEAIGLPARRIRIAGFTLSSALAGMAGVLAAQHIQFVSPDLMIWTASGEALVVLILGGIGTLAGPVLGAAIFVALKHWAAGFTDHWHLLIGALLILVVLAGGRGLFGQLETRLRHDRD
ncbi:branched-chain amino acid ABC transporter permease [Paracoccus aerodenitrificans]|uniref:branched-chain amino acid ABC transporter permease n=1 Tax=Paracoccus aerodenitrificans TaxID=3017781 RepID=UPI0022F0A9BD|nr:branched-chain amino acid ABC transporter permease [Paracoccus aerodenitrificans]WBU64058.1 branched-chain amino acid ABC transporter permease [Paracoccus aerodenitrificans]